jgi:hypothetical protein
MAGDLRSELLSIRQRRGILTPRVVLEEATDPDSPLHHRFTWDDSDAAEKWRLHEASQLLRITFRASMGGRPADLRAFWVVKGDRNNPESRYEPIEEIAPNPIAKTIMMQQMRRDWQRFRARYENHTEFFEMIQEDWPADWPLPDLEEPNGSDG